MQDNRARLLLRIADLTGWEEAPDLLQETFLRVYRAGRVKPGSKLSPWYLLRAADNTARDYLRSQRKTQNATVEYLERFQ